MGVVYFPTCFYDRILTTSESGVNCFYQWILEKRHGKQALFREPKIFIQIGILTPHRIEPGKHNQLMSLAMRTLGYVVVPCILHNLSRFHTDIAGFELLMSL